jgi:hypothetical protein
MAELGYKGIPLDALIRMRDHGVDPAYVRRLQQRGMSNLRWTRSSAGATAATIGNGAAFTVSSDRLPTANPPAQRSRDHRDHLPGWLVLWAVFARNQFDFCAAHTKLSSAFSAPSIACERCHIDLRHRRRCESRQHVQED